MNFQAHIVTVGIGTQGMKHELDGKLSQSRSQSRPVELQDNSRDTIGEPSTQDGSLLPSVPSNGPCTILRFSSNTS